MLRVIRTFLALIAFLAITMLFLDFTGTAASDWGWLVRYQVIPALLSANLVAIVVLAALTFIFGRVYCSVLCPLGVMQDIIARISIWLRPRRRRRIGVYGWKPAHSRIRYGVLIAFVVLLALGLLNLLASSIAALIEPYSAYGRIATGLIKPVYVAANNALAAHDAETGSYTFYFVTNVIAPAITAVGGSTLLVTGLFAVLTGRGSCNTICPVGTLLGFISKYALFRPTIDLAKCNNCVSCGRHCKAQCINTKAHEIDYSRCVACMDCIGHCTQGALKYRLAYGPGAREIASHVQPARLAPKPKPAPAPKTEAPKAENAQAPTAADPSRRSFLTIVGLATGAAIATAADAATEKVTDGGLTALKKRGLPVRETRITPPGSVSHAHLAQHCVACQLCVQACPGGVIRTSTDADTFMQPYVEYSTDSYCRPECTVCSNICPAGAFHPLDEAAKSSTKIGTAVVDRDICLAANGQPCGNCARRCPAGAIEMVPMSEAEDEKRFIPMVNAQACIGCGICEAHCPVGTVASMDANVPAIHVEGLSVQRTI